MGWAVCLTANGCALHDGSPSRPDHQAADVHRALEGFLSDFENLEGESFREWFADGACVFHPSGETLTRVCGKTQVESSFQKVFSEIRKSSSGPPFMKLDPQRIEVQMLGQDIAVVSFELRNAERLARRTIVWQRQSDGWRIIHLHASNIGLTSG